MGRETNCINISELWLSKLERDVYLCPDKTEKQASQMSVVP